MKILVVDDDLVTGALLNKVLTKLGKGVGLGLTTALNIIRMHNGSIICRSEPGIETVFTVRLPDSGGTA
jgi:signal transduction histidine kinase